jgi:AbrB family looped-hinge helix DNA binding protein
VKVTSRGRITIPQAVREQLGLLPGTEVEFVVEGDTARIRAVRTDRGRSRAIVQRLRGQAKVRMTTDEIMMLTRGE